MFHKNYLCLSFSKILVYYLKINLQLYRLYHILLSVLKKNLYYKWTNDNVTNRCKQVHNTNVPSVNSVDLCVKHNRYKSPFNLSQIGLVKRNKKLTALVQYRRLHIFQNLFIFPVDLANLFRAQILIQKGLLRVYLGSCSWH